MNNIIIIYMHEMQELDKCFFEKLKRMYNKMIVIHKPPMECETRKILEGITKDIIVEDFKTAKEAWKFGYKEYLTEEERNKCSELALIYKNFTGVIVNSDKMVRTIQNLEADAVHICCADEANDVDKDFLILKKRILQDYLFDEFWQTTEDEFELFTNKGFQCIDYYGNDIFITLRGKVSSSVENDELKKRIRAITDSKFIEKEIKESLYKLVIQNSSYKRNKEVFDLDFILHANSQQSLENGITLCMFVETEEGLEKVNSVIKKLNQKWNIYVFLREEEFEEIIEKREFLHVDLYYRECMWEKIIQTVNSCQDYMIGFIFENGDILNWEKNFQDLFGSEDVIAQIEKAFIEKKYMAAMLPWGYVGSDRFIRNEVHRVQIQNTIETLWDNEIPECAICCNTDVIKECINNIEDDRILECCELESIKLLPYLLHKNGYATGQAISDKNIVEYCKKLREINENMITCTMKAGKIFETDFTQFMNKTVSLLNGYFEIKKKLKNDNKKLKEDIAVLKERKKNGWESEQVEIQVKEVPVLVEIGVKQAVKNWCKKRIGKGKND